MSGTFKSSRLVEELKLGALSVTLGGGRHVHCDPSGESGLPLTFTQDRALTAVQLLLAWQELRPSGVVVTPDRMRGFDWMAEAPYVEVDTLSFCRAYTGTSAKRVDNDALWALRDLAGRDFYTAFPPPGGAIYQVVHSPILMLQEAGVSENRYPSHLRIILSPVLLHGINDVEPRYLRKPTDLYARIDLALGAGRGKRSPQLPRLASWIAVQRRNLIEVGSEKLARQLRSGYVSDGHSKRFVKTVSRYLEVLKKAEIVRSFVAPSKATGGHWKIVRYPVVTRKPSR